SVDALVHDDVRPPSHSAPQTSHFFLHAPPPHRHLHSFPTRRSSDLVAAPISDTPWRTVSVIPSMALPVRFFRLSHREESLPSVRSEEHTSELQSRFDLVCRLLLEKKNRALRT